MVLRDHVYQGTAIKPCLIGACKLDVLWHEQPIKCRQVDNTSLGCGTHVKYREEVFYLQRSATLPRQNDILVYCV